ncbi:MAG TPA: TIGR02300 family protein [Rhabdaerophilum sp.]|nr:TIGR02300 family protein [Rhabdaerophilum sp.]
MPKDELGTKRICPVTGKKFYDLGRDPIVSPYTGQSYARSYFDPQPKVAKAEADEESDDEVVDTSAELVPLEDAEADEKVVVGTDDDVDLGDDDDDTFLEADEDEDDGDVSDLIDNDIDEDEEG